MAERIAYVEAVFGADITAFRRGTAQVRRDLNLLSDTAAGMSRIGRNMTLMLTAPLIAMGGAAVKASGDFEASMRNVNSILFAAEDQFQALSAETLRFGATLRSGPVAAADALYTVVSAGFIDLGEAMRVSQVAAKTAEAGLADLATTAEALSAAMLAYGAGSEEAAHYSDVLTRSVQIGVGEMQEFANSMGLMVSSGVGLGITYDELGASQAFLTQRGLSASRAATSLNMALVALMKPTEAMKQVFNELGVASGQELVDQFGSLEGAFGALADVFDGDAARITSVFGREQGARAARSIILDLQGYTAAMEEFREAVGGATDRALAEQYKSFPAMLDRLASAATTAGIAIGDKLVPFLRPAVEGLRQLLLGVTDIPDEMMVMGLAIGAAVTAAGPLLWLLGSLLSPIGLVSGGVAALGAAVALNIGGARDTFMTFVNDVTGGLDGLVGALGKFWSEFSRKPETPDLSGDFSSATRGLSFTITEEASTLWDVFQQNGEAWGFETYDGFYEALTRSMGDIDPYTLQIGDVFTFGGGGGGGMRRNEMLAEMEFAQSQADDFTFGGRIKAGIEAAWPDIELALNTIKTNVSTWFTSTFLPSFDSFGTGVLQALSSAFKVEPNISGPLDQAEDWMLPSDEDGLVGTVKTFISETLLGGVTEGINLVEQNLPGISASVEALFSRVGEWVLETGLPSLSYSLGYLGGAVSSLIVNALAGGADVTGIGETLGDSVLSPFAEGFADAKMDAGLADSIAPEIVSGIMLAIPLIGPMLLSRGFGPSLGRVVVGSMSGAFPVILGVAGKFTSVFGSMFATALIDHSIISDPLQTLILRGMYAMDWVRNIGPAVAGGLAKAVGFAFSAGVVLAAVAGGTLLLSQAINNAWRNAAYAEPETTVTIPVDSPIVEMTGELQMLTAPGVNASEEAKSTLRSNLRDEINEVLMENNAGWVGDPFNIPLPAELQFNVPPEEINMLKGFLNGEGIDTENGLASQIGPANLAAEALRGNLVGEENSVQAGLAALNENTAFQHLQGMTNEFDGAVQTAAGQVTGLHSSIQEVAKRWEAELHVRVTGDPLPQFTGTWSGPVADDARASGGSVLPGKSYLVGERGPELLTMGSTSGFISSNGSLAGAVSGGGGGNVVSNNQVTINGVQDVEGLLYELERRGIYL